MDCSFCQRKDELRLLSHLQKQSTGGTNRVCRVFRGKFLGIIQFTCHRGFRQQKVVRWRFPRNTRNTRKRSASRLSPADARSACPSVQPSSGKLYAFRRRPSARPCASLRSAQVPDSPGGPVHAGEAAGRVQRTAECPGRDGRKAIFRAVDGGAPARAKHGGFTGPIKFLSCLSCVSREMVLGKSTV